ncbi:hypothetical protein AHAS_Ahas13G0263700 [Arachis hypogaea]
MDPNNAANANVANPNGDEQQRRVLGSYSTPTVDLYGKSIVVPPIAANNFELKPQLICNTVKTNEVNSEVYKLMLFPFALRDGAKPWLDSQPKESLDTWDKVVTEFLTKFFPPKKLTKLRVEVQTFRQKDGETLYETWERYKLLTRQCPPDMFSNWTQLDIFYEGLGEMSKMCLDNSTGGSLHKKKTPEETIELIELVASNRYLYSSNRNPVNSEAPQKKGVMEVEALNATLVQNKLMSQQISLLTQQMGGMQISAINTQNPSQEVSYDMTAALWNHNSNPVMKLWQGNRNKKHLSMCKFYCLFKSACPPELQHQACEESSARQTEQEPPQNVSPRPWHWEDDAPSFSLGISLPTFQPSPLTSQPIVTQFEMLADAVMDAGVTVALKFAEERSVEPSFTTPEAYKTPERKMLSLDDTIKIYKDTTNEYDTIFMFDHEAHLEGTKLHFMSLTPGQDVENTVVNAMCMLLNYGKYLQFEEEIYYVPTYIVVNQIFLHD